MIMSKQGQKKETDFGAVNSWLEENVLPMLMEKCASPLEAIYLLTSFTKNAALTIGVAAGQPPKRVITACKDIFDKKDYAEEALTMMAALMAKKIEKNGGVADLSDAIDSVEEITRKLDEQN